MSKALQWLLLTPKEQRPNCSIFKLKIQCLKISEDPPEKYVLSINKFARLKLLNLILQSLQNYA